MLPGSPQHGSVSWDGEAQRETGSCLIPPWPAAIATIGATAVGIAAVERRGAVRLSPALADDPPGQVGALTPLKILYREQLLGAFRTVLAESEYGEALLATLPRASNRHGYIVVSSLQLSVASAQTHYEDVARLLEYLLIWCATHAEPAARPYQQQAGDAQGDNTSEQFAPIAIGAGAGVASAVNCRGVAARANARGCMTTKENLCAANSTASAVCWHCLSNRQRLIWDGHRLKRMESYPRRWAMRQAMRHRYTEMRWSVIAPTGNLARDCADCGDCARVRVMGRAMRCRKSAGSRRGRRA